MASTSTRAFASSSVSRTAASAVVSPFSMNPAGSVHNPDLGSMARRHSSTLPSRSATHPATIFGFW